MSRVWPLLYLYKGIALWAVASFLLAVCTFGLSWFVLPFFANGQHQQHLLKRGYLTREQVEARRQHVSA